MWQQRIILDEKILRGKPLIKGTRLSVDFILDLLANGWTNEKIFENYPQVTTDDIKACLEQGNLI